MPANGSFSRGKPKKKAAKRSRHLLMVFGLIAALGLGAGALALVRDILSTGSAPQKKIVENIQIIRPPPPPPDLPPPPPPPPEEKVDLPDPQEKPDPTPSNEPPPAEQLGLDADGGAGGDAFGLVGRKGGRDLIASGGSAFAWYAGLLKSEITDALSEEKSARRGAYSVIIRIWVAPDGTVQKVRLAESSGDKERDKMLEAALAHREHLSQAPPADMPMPISLRIVSRG